MIWIQKATAIPSKKAEYFDASEPVQNRVYKSLKVWSMLADLEESLGTFQVWSVFNFDTYEQMMFSRYISQGK